MSKDSSAKYYQNDKERTQRKAHERYQILSKEEKEKKNMVIWYKIYQWMRIKSLLSAEKNIIKWQKTLCYNYKKLFRKSTIILKSNDLESSFDEEYIKAKYQDGFLRMQFWSYKYSSKSWFK